MKYGDCAAKDDDTASGSRGGLLSDVLGMISDIFLSKGRSSDQSSQSIREIIQAAVNIIKQTFFLRYYSLY